MKRSYGLNAAGELVRNVINKPEVYADVLVGMIQAVGFSATIALTLCFFLMLLCWSMYKATIKTHECATKTLNEQNKKYQDYFLTKRKSSGENHLGEDNDVDNSN